MKWLNATEFVLEWSMIGRLMVCANYAPFALTILIHLLSGSDQLAPASAADWLNKGREISYHVYVIKHVKDQ